MPPVQVVIRSLDPPRDFVVLEYSTAAAALDSLEYVEPVPTGEMAAVANGLEVSRSELRKLAAEEHDVQQRR